MYASLSFPLYALAAIGGATLATLAIRAGLVAVVGLTISSLMAAFYTRLPVRLTQGAAAVVVILTTSLAGAAVWAWIQLTMAAITDQTSVLYPEIQRSSYAGLIVIKLIRGFIVLGLWSALFFMFLLSHRVQAASTRALEAARRANDAQLQLLRAQLNPHFMFNALNSVVALVEADPLRAKEMVRNLSALLRSALADPDAPSRTVGDELDFVVAYLKCERVRYEDRLQITISVPESIKRQPLPSMSIQPLVENAIKHGMRGRAPLDLRIEGKEDGGYVEITVVNSRPPEVAHAGTGTGTGLNNVRARIEMMFPESGEVRLQHEERWSTATIRYCPSRLP